MAAPAIPKINSKSATSTASPSKKVSSSSYPNGTGRMDDKILTWNGGTCCGYAMTNSVDNVAFAGGDQPTQMIWEFFTAHPKP